MTETSKVTTKAIEMVITHRLSREYAYGIGSLLHEISMLEMNYSIDIIKPIALDIVKKAIAEKLNEIELVARI